MRPLIVLLLAVALLAAACGGNSNGPSVAGDGDATGNSSAGHGGPSLDSNSSTGGGGAGGVMKLSNGAKFASCMRKNGVPSFPDPSTGGSITFGGSSGINPDSPKFRAAEAKCRSVLPNGGQPTPQQQAKMQQQALAFSRCMRAHGVPNFPDPQFTDGGMRIGLRGGKGSINPSSPAFKRAQTACASNLPGKIQAGGAKP